MNGGHAYFLMLGFFAGMLTCAGLIGLVDALK
jgi:hypothetical protein